jgi:nitroreductase
LVTQDIQESGQSERFERWRATIWYRTDSGLIDVEHTLEELEEIQALVERGPDWYALERIEIVHIHSEGETIEQRNMENAR